MGGGEVGIGGDRGEGRGVEMGVWGGNDFVDAGKEGDIEIIFG